MAIAASMIHSCERAPMSISRIALTILFLLTGGCAFVDLTVTPALDTFAQPSTVGRGREIVLQMPFEDQRPLPGRCGMQKNGYNMDTATVRCSVPPPRWLSEALRVGLLTAGFRVHVNKGPQHASSVRVDGTVLQFFVEPDLGFLTFTPEADISVKLVLTSPSGLRAERVFYVKGTETSLVGTESNFQKAVDSSTRQAVKAMVSAIASLLDRYPQLGASDTQRTAAVSLLSGEEASR